MWHQFPGWRWAFFNILIWLMPLLVAFGIAVNLMCFLAIIRSPKTFPKFSRQNMLIIAACDIGVLAVGAVSCYHNYWNKTMGYSIVTSFLGLQHNSPASCHIVNFLNKYLLNGTPFFQVGLTIERVLAVVMPLKVKQIITARTHTAILVALLLIGSVDSALWSAGQEYYNGKCGQRRDESVLKILDKLQYNIEFYVSKITLFTILLLGCIIVTVALKRQTKKVARMSNNASNAKRGKMISACVVMIAMNVLFFLTHAPRAAFSVYEGYSNLHNGATLSDSEVDLVNQVLQGVVYLHSLFDPFAYFIGKGFRRAFKENLRDMSGPIAACLCRQRPSRKETAATSVTNTAVTGF